MPTLTSRQVRPVKKQQRYRTTKASKQPRGARLLTGLLSILALLALVHFLIMMYESTLQVAAPTTCAHLIRNTDYTKYVQFNPATQQVGAIQYVDQLVGGQPAALVQVTNAQNTIDVYVYGCIMQHKTPSLTILMKQQGLLQGAVSLSQANTLILSERDTQLPQAMTAMLQPMQQNLYQEYRWHNGAFVQVAFPGLYPVADRSEAEALQQQANNGASLPWSDPQITAEQMAKDILQWSPGTYQLKILDNHGTTAHLLLEQMQPSMEVTVTLQRIIQNNQQGLWFVTSAQTPNINLDSTQLVSPVTSPLALHGTVGTKDGQLTATLFDHTLTAMSSLNSTVLSVTSDGSYAGSVLYNDNKQVQQGLLLLENTPSSKGKTSGQLLLTSILLG